MVAEAALDRILVPLGLALMAAYHAWLFHWVAKHPRKTAMGLNAINRQVWVQAMMEEYQGKNWVVAVQTMRNSIMSSTLLATAAIMLSSLIAVLMANNGGATPVFQRSGIVYGDRSELCLTVKYLSLLLCFFAAFLLNVHSIQYYTHASALINVPARHRGKTASMSPDYVARAVNKGNRLWSMGLRAFYFSLPLFVWLFGPIPMFVCCVVLVFALYFLDVCMTRCLRVLSLFMWTTLKKETE